MDYYQVKARATESGSTSPIGQVIAGAQQCLILPVQHGQLSGESLGNSVWFYQSNMNYYQVIAGAQQYLILPV